MSLNSKEFINVKKAITAVLNKNIKKDVLHVRVQGYSLHPVVILEQMLDKNSPFMWEDPQGNKLSRSEISSLARVVSKDLYETYKGVAIRLGGKSVTGKTLPKSFNDNSKVNMGYDDRKKIIFFSGTSPDNYRPFTEQVIKKVETAIKASRAPEHPTRVFIEPNAEWMKLKNEFQAKTKAEGLGDTARTSRLKAFREESLKKGIIVYEGIQSGHAFGGAVSAASEILPVLHLLPKAIQPIVVGIVEKIESIDANIKMRKVFGPTGVKTEFTLLLPESTVRNIQSGGGTGKPLTQLKRVIIAALPELKGSPSNNDLLQLYIENLFLGKTNSRKTFSTKSSINLKRKTTIQINSIPIRKGTVSYNETKGNSAKGDQTSLRRIIAIINRKLHNKIRKNMGKGLSQQKLNYRTGRFARSALVESLYPSKDKNSIEAKVKYMRSPYGVFEKGGKLYKPLRDPAGIFGRSIRQILQEEKIANLNRVKVTLRGQ